MLVVTIEMYPVGDFGKRRIIGSALIMNDGTGTPESGNYKAKIWKDGFPIGTPIIKDFPRHDLDAWDLLVEVIKKRKKGKKENGNKHD